MRDLINDILNEHFTMREAVRYGILYPLGLIAACALAEYLSNMSY